MDTADATTPSAQELAAYVTSIGDGLSLSHSFHLLGMFTSTRTSFRS